MSSTPPPLPIQSSTQSIVGVGQRQPKKATSWIALGCLAAILIPITIGGLIVGAQLLDPSMARKREQRSEHEAQERQAKALQKQAEQQQRAARDAELNAKTEKFKQWALQNTAVTDIAINNNRTMFVTLKPEKYTNRDNVRVIAETLARYYANQVGIDYAVCHVYLGNEEYAKGTFSR